LGAALFFFVINFVVFQQQNEKSETAKKIPVEDDGLYFCTFAVQRN